MLFLRSFVTKGLLRRWVTHSRRSKSKLLRDYFMQEQMDCGLTMHFDRKNPPPRRDFQLLCSLIKNPEEEDPFRSTWYKFFERGPHPPGSWWGKMVNRKTPRGGVLSIKLFCSESKPNMVAASQSFHRCRRSVEYFLIDRSIGHGRYRQSIRNHILKKRKWDDIYHFRPIVSFSVCGFLSTVDI